MPGHTGGSSVQDLIGNALNIQQLLLQRRSQDENERQQLASRIALFQSIAARTSREGQAVLAAQFEDQGLVGDTDLDILFAGTAQDPASTASRSVERGAKVLTDDEKLRLDREAVIREITGGGSLGFALSGQAGELTSEQLIRALEADIGVGLTEDQTIDAEIRREGLALNWISIVDRSALGEAELAVRMSIAEMDQRLGLARILASGNDDAQATASLNTFASLARNLEANQRGMSETDILAHYLTMQTIFQRLFDQGYPMDPHLFDDVISEIRKDGVNTDRPWWERLFKLGAR